MASTLKHLRSSTADKRPTASGLADGQLAINTASGTPGLFFKDSAGQVVKVGPVHVGPTPPNDAPAGSSGNSRGELWVDNSLTTPGLNYYTGTAFVNLTPSGTTSSVGLVELATNAETQTGSDGVRAVTPAGLQSKVSDSVSTTSSISIASSTAVKTAYDLAAAALPASGGRVTGTLEIGPSGFIAFEGSSDDSFETFLTAVNPTADRTITFPNITGTLITDADTGTVTNTMLAGSIATTKLANGALPSGVTVNSSNIVDGSIVNADISASAAIAYSKLSLGTSIVDGDISTTAAIAGTKISPDFGSQNIVTTGNVNIDGGTFYVDAVNNRVGVGTTTPATLLDLSSTTTSAKLNLTYPGFGIATLASDSTGALLLQADEANTQANSLIQFKVDGGEKLRLDASGNLGLGVVPSAWGFGKAIQAGTSTNLWDDAGGAAYLVNNGYFNGANWIYRNTSFASNYRQVSGAHIWSTAPSGTAGAAITFTQSMTLDASGNLGIKNTSPTSYNAAADDLVVGLSGDTGMTIVSGAASQGSIFFADGTTGGTQQAAGYLYYLHSNDSMGFGTANTQRMTILSDGKIGIGTYAPTENLTIFGASSRLAVTGSSGSSAVLLGNQNSGGLNNPSVIEAANGSLYFGGGNSWSGGGTFDYTMTLTDGNRVGIGTTSPSYRLHVSNDGNNSQPSVLIQNPNAGGSAATYLSLASNSTQSAGLTLTSTGWGNYGLFKTQSAVLEAGGTSSTFLGLAGQAGILFGVGAGPYSEAARIDSSGRLLIGQTGTGLQAARSLAWQGSGEGALYMSHSTSDGNGDPFINFGYNANLIGKLIQVGNTGIGLYSNDALTFGTAGSERARIDSSGRLLVGTNLSRTYTSLGQPQFQIEGIAYAQSSFGLTNNQAAVDGPYLVFNKTRGTVVGSNTVVNTGDLLGSIWFQGADGTNNIRGAMIEAFVDATPGANDMPGRLVFSTTADGAASPTPRFTINRVGDAVFSNTSAIYPATDNAVTCGGSSNRWSAVWAANGTIQTSDKRAKADIADSTLGADFIKSLRPVSYKWIDGGKRNTGERDEDSNYIYESVPGARTHWGFIAQEVKQAVDAAGIDFGGWVLTDKDDPDSQQALRYDQFIAPLTKALQEALEKIETLEAKVAALESR